LVTLLAKTRRPCFPTLFAEKPNPVSITALAKETKKKVKFTKRRQYVEEKPNDVGGAKMQIGFCKFFFLFV
jgi:hypothetical protein